MFKKISIILIIILSFFTQVLNTNGEVLKQEILDLVGDWMSIGDNIAPIQVEIKNDTTNGNTMWTNVWDWTHYYMLPTYATLSNLESWLPLWCTKSTSVENLPKWAIKVICQPAWWKTSLENFKSLLQRLKITNSHTTYWDLLKDIYIPKYYIIEQEVTINKNKLIFNWNDIWYNDPSTKIKFVIYDPDFWNSNWANWVYEKTLYVKDWNTPNTWIEVFGLDWHRLSPNTIKLWAYTLEHYLTSNKISYTYDTNSLFWVSTNSLKYVLNQYTPYFEEKVFKEICNYNNVTDLYKNDDIANNNIKYRKFFWSWSTRMEKIDNWDCSWVSWLRTTDPPWTILVNWSMLSNWSLKIESTTPEIIVNNVKRHNDLESTYLMNIPNTFWNNQIVSVKIPAVWIIWNKNQYSSTNNWTIATYLNWKKVKMYFLMKMTAYIPWNTDKDRYLVWLDPVNPKYYNLIYINSETNKYLYWWHITKLWLRPWAWDANYYVLLWATGDHSDTWTQPSTIYSLSAPWYAEKWSEIKSWLADNDINAFNRAKNMHLNISSWYMETERTNKSNNKPDITLVSQTRTFPVEPGWKWTHVLFRNFDADMDRNPYSNTNNLDQNLDYILAYKSSSSKIWFAVNSMQSWWNLNWITSSNNMFWWSFWLNDKSNAGSYSCISEINNTNFNSIYNIWQYNWVCWDFQSSQTLSSNFESNTYYQQFQWKIEKKSVWWDAISDWLLLQAVSNAWDTEVYNQIYLNTNYVVWLPNKDTIKCNIKLFKIPVDTSKINYASEFNSLADLTTNSVYSQPTNVFWSPASYIHKDTLKSLFWVSYNQWLENNYYNLQYKNATDLEQQWLVWEKWIVYYVCVKNNFEQDSVRVLITTSDERFFKDVNWNFVSAWTTNKLSTPLFSYNTWSWIWWRKTLDWFKNSAKYTDWPLKSNYISIINKWGFNLRVYDEKNIENNIPWEFSIWRDLEFPSKFIWWIEVKTDTTTAVWNTNYYWKINVLIYDKNRPWEILDQKSFYVLTKKRDWVAIGAVWNTAKWWDTTDRSKINHIDWITFSVTNTTFSTITATDTTKWFNVLVMSLSWVNLIPNGTTLKWYTDSLTACTSLWVNCWTNVSLTKSQNWDEYLKWTLWAWNTAIPKISVKITNAAWTVVKNTIVNQNTKHATSFAWNISSKNILNVIFPWDYQKLEPWDKLEITLKANTWSFTALNWMEPSMTAELNQATAFSVFLADGNWLYPWISYTNYSPVITKTITPNNDAACNLEFSGIYNDTNWNLRSWDWKKLYLSENAVKVASWNPNAKCWDLVWWVPTVCLINVTPVVYPWNLWEVAYSKPTAMTSVPQWKPYSFFLQVNQQYRSHTAWAWYQFLASNSTPSAFEAIPLKWDLRFSFAWINNISKRKIMKFTQDQMKAIWKTVSWTTATFNYSWMWITNLNWGSSIWLVNVTPTSINSIFKYPNFCDWVTTPCWNTSTSKWNIVNSVFYWVVWNSTWNPQWNLSISFDWSAENNRNGVDLRNKTCNISTVNFPTAPPVTPARWYCGIIKQEVQNWSNNINVCDWSWGWTATANSISLEKSTTRESFDIFI